LAKKEYVLDAVNLTVQFLDNFKYRFLILKLMQFRHEAVKELRTRLGVSQLGLAKILYEAATVDNYAYPEVTRAAISSWERGIISPKREYAMYLEQIARDKGFLDLEFYKQG